MEQISVIMILIGLFTFLGCGLSAANSVEAKKSETAANLLAILTFAGCISAVLGFLILIISKII